MRILIITPHYPPDGGASAPLFQLLARGLAGRGHEVTVLTATPHYPLGRAPETWKQKRPEFDNGVAVLRMRLPDLDRANLASRLVQFVFWQLRAAANLFGLPSQDVVIASGPGLQNALPFLLATIVLAPTVSIFSVHDLYPAAGIQAGIFRNSLVAGCVAALEKACIGRADFVRFLAPSFRKPLSELGATADQLRFIPDWVDTDEIVELPKNNSFARSIGLDDKFVILYAGNAGPSHGLGYLADVAKRLSNLPHIHILVVGGGEGWRELHARKESELLANLSLLPFQPRAELPLVLATADIALVSLKRGFSGSLPSKTLSHLASGRPVIAAVDADSDTARLVRQTGGSVVAPQSVSELASEIVRLSELSNEALAALGTTARQHIVSNNSVAAAVDRFESMFLPACPLNSQRRP